MSAPGFDIGGGTGEGTRMLEEEAFNSASPLPGSQHVFDFPAGAGHSHSDFKSEESGDALSGAWRPALEFLPRQTIGDGLQGRWAEPAGPRAREIAPV